MKALITGAEGFIGSYLAESLLNDGVEVFGTVNSKNLQNLEGIMKDIEISNLDISDRVSFENIVNKVKPDFVYHLAAQAYVVPSWQDIETTLKVNIFGTLFMLDSIRKAGIDPAIVVACSSAEYGLTYPDEIPIKENKEFRPSSPYAMSKVSTDMLSYIYWRAYEMKIIRARLFNTIGPRKRGSAIADFSQMIAMAEKNDDTEIAVGNLDSTIDFTDVRDTVRALKLLAENGTYGDAYNICTGNGSNLKEVLEKLIKLSYKPLKIRQDPAKFRQSDDPIFVGDNSKLIKLGWKPTIGLDVTLKDTLDYWRQQRV
jgi:GDP-4-dehydro-6-deoxy-D-mannose reductase